MLNIGSKITEFRKAQAELANVFDVSVDYLLGEGQHASYDKEPIKRLQAIQDMKPDFRVHLFSVIDSEIRDYKTQQAYSS